MNFLHSSPRVHALLPNLFPRALAHELVDQSCIDRAFRCSRRELGLPTDVRIERKDARSARATRPDNGSKWRRTVLAAGWMHRQWHSLSLLSVSRRRLALLSFPLTDWTPPPPPRPPPSVWQPLFASPTIEGTEACTAFNRLLWPTLLSLSLSPPRFPYIRDIRFRGGKVSFEKISKIMEEILKLVFLVFVINYTFDGRALCFLCALDSHGSKRFLVSLCNTFSRRKRGKEKKEDGLKFFKKIRGNCSEKVKSGLVTFYFNDDPASSLPPLFSSSSKASPLLSLSFRWEKVRDETSGKRKTHSSIRSVLVLGTEKSGCFVLRVSTCSSARAPFSVFIISNKPKAQNL